MLTKFHFKFILYSFLFLLVFTSCNSNNNAQGKFNADTKVDYPYYNNLSEAVEASTDIILGIVVEDQGIKEYILEDELGPEYTTILPYRIYVLEVAESLKGTLAKGDKVTVKVDNIEEEKELTKDGLYFLEVYQDNSEPASIVNPMQGNIPIEEDLLKVNSDTKQFFNESNLTERSIGTSKSNITIPVKDAFSEIKSLTQVSETSTVIDYPYYNNLTEAVEASTDVIRGTIVEDQGIKEYILEDDLGPEYTTKLPYRIYTLEVTESLKGNLSTGDQITVRVDNIEELKELTEDGLYFLEVLEDKNEPANIINPMQAAIPIENDTLQLNSDTEIFFSETNPNIETAAEEITQTK